MGLEIAWLALLGLLLAGYFILGGYDYGVQMLQPHVGRDDSGRRSTLGALGPFFLGNEVWLVTFAAVLFGAFPILEGTLLSGLYPLIAAIVIGVVLGNAAVQLRSRQATPAGRRVWDALAVAGGLVPAVTWGLVVGILLGGVPLAADGSFSVTLAALATPFVLLCGVTTATAFAAHGATFLSMRMSGVPARRAQRAGHRLLPATAALAAITAATGALTADVRAAVRNPLVTALLAAAIAGSLVVARRALRRDRSGRAFTATACAAALPVPLVGAGLFPYILPSTVATPLGLTISEAAADTATLQLLGWFTAPLLPIILAYQFWNWWAFRGRIGESTPSYF